MQIRIIDREDCRSMILNTSQALPQEMRRVQLAQDYRRMQSMLFGPIPSFEDIMHGLTEFESELHMHSTV